MNRIDFVDAQRRAFAAMTTLPPRRVSKPRLIRLYRFDADQGETIRAGSYATIQRAELAAASLSARYRVEVRNDALPYQERVQQHWHRGRKTFDRKELS